MLQEQDRKPQRQSQQQAENNTTTSASSASSSSSSSSASASAFNAALYFSAHSGSLSTIERLLWSNLSLLGWESFAKESMSAGGFPARCLQPGSLRLPGAQQSCQRILCFLLPLLGYESHGDGINGHTSSSVEHPIFDHRMIQRKELPAFRAHVASILKELQLQGRLPAGAGSFRPSDLVAAGGARTQMLMWRLSTVALQVQVQVERRRLRSYRLTAAAATAAAAAATTTTTTARNGHAHGHNNNNGKDIEESGKNDSQVEKKCGTLDSGSSSLSALTMKNFEDEDDQGWPIPIPEMSTFNSIPRSSLPALLSCWQAQCVQQSYVCRERLDQLSKIRQQGATTRSMLRTHLETLQGQLETVRNQRKQLSNPVHQAQGPSSRMLCQEVQDTHNVLEGAVRGQIASGLCLAQSAVGAQPRFRLQLGSQNIHDTINQWEHQARDALRMLSNGLERKEDVELTMSEVARFCDESIENRKRIWKRASDAEDGLVVDVIPAKEQEIERLAARVDQLLQAQEQRKLWLSGAGSGNQPSSLSTPQSKLRLAHSPEAVLPPLTDLRRRGAADALYSAAHTPFSPGRDVARSVRRAAGLSSPFSRTSLVDRPVPNSTLVRKLFDEQVSNSPSRAAAAAAAIPKTPPSPSRPAVHSTPRGVSTPGYPSV